MFIPLLYRFVKPFRFYLIILSLVAISWALTISVRPYILKLLVDGVNQGASFSHIKDYALYYFLISLAFPVLFRLNDYVEDILLMPALRRRIGLVSFESLLEKDYPFFQNRFSGSLSNKVNDLMSSIPDFINIIFGSFMHYSLAILFAVYTLSTVQTPFALGMICWTLAFVTYALWHVKKFSYLSEIYSETVSTITGKIVDVISNIVTVRLFAKQKNESNDLKENLDASLIAERKLAWAQFWLWGSYGFSFVILQGVNLYFLTNGYQQGTITAGDFVVVLSLNIAIIDFMWKFTLDFSRFSKLKGKIEQATKDIFALSHLKEGTKKLKISQGSISFNRVSFGYKKDTPLFQDLSLDIAGGQKVGLVGYSGSGKTSFVNLLLRLFDYESGKILIDGQKIQDLTYQSLHRAIGMIPQDPTLFHRSLAENIGYGSENPSLEKIIEAAQKAHTHEFITDLPEGYNSLVGERGIKLSGGQRQRIAIARAILKDSPILILDEATSQLDSITETNIQDALWQVMRNKTTIVIAHRLSTLLTMDRIVVFDKGKIVEDGPHEILLSQKGLYATLWQTQVGGFIRDQPLS